MTDSTDVATAHDMYASTIDSSYAAAVNSYNVYSAYSVVGGGDGSSLTLAHYGSSEDEEASDDEDTDDDVEDLEEVDKRARARKAKQEAREARRAALGKLARGLAVGELELPAEEAEPAGVSRSMHELEQWTAEELLAQAAELQGSARRAAADAEPADGNAWNLRFQQALELPMSSVEEESLRAERVKEVVDEFVATASAHGRVIVEELHVPEDERTIKPAAQFGGTAGGEKYIVDGILFKFARDDKGLYGGDEFAMKAADNELRGYSALLGVNLAGISIPMTALLDYHGHRLTATTLLPLSGQSLLYGTDDGGKTIHNDDPAVDRKMAAVAAQFHLQSHWILPRDPTCEPKVVHTCGDLEGHLGQDGRYYMLDCARLFAPTFPTGKHVNEHLYNQFRPEFMSAYPKRLSSDALTRFGRHNYARHEAEIAEATCYLLTRTIPEFAAYLVDNFAYLQSDLEKWAALLHRFGINVRYLGLVRQHVLNYPTLKRTLAKDPHAELANDWDLAVKALTGSMLMEMIARTMKLEVRAIMRNVDAQGSREQGNLRVRAVVSYWTRLVTGHLPQSEKYWFKHLKERVMDKFPDALTAEEKGPDVNLTQRVDMWWLSSRLHEMVGVSFEIGGTARDLMNAPPNKDASGPSRRQERKVRLYTHAMRSRARREPNPALIDPNAEVLPDDCDEFVIAALRDAGADENEPDDERLVQTAESVSDIGMRVKRLFVVPRNIGQALMRRALATPNRAEADAMFERASDEFEKVYNSKPDDAETLVLWGEALTARAALNKSIPAQARRHFAAALTKFTAASELSANSPSVLRPMGRALLRSCAWASKSGRLAAAFRASSCFASAAKALAADHVTLAECLRDWAEALHTVAALRVEYLLQDMNDDVAVTGSRKHDLDACMRLCSGADDDALLGDGVSSQPAVEALLGDAPDTDSPLSALVVAAAERLSAAAWLERNGPASIDGLTLQGMLFAWLLTSVSRVARFARTHKLSKKVSEQDLLRWRNKVLPHCWKFLHSAAERLVESVGDGDANNAEPMAVRVAAAVSSAITADGVKDTFSSEAVLGALDADTQWPVALSGATSRLYDLIVTTGRVAFARAKLVEEEHALADGAVVEPQAPPEMAPEPTPEPVKPKQQDNRGGFCGCFGPRGGAPAGDEQAKSVSANMLDQLLEPQAKVVEAEPFHRVALSFFTTASRLANWPTAQLHCAPPGSTGSYLLRCTSESRWARHAAYEVGTVMQRIAEYDASPEGRRVLAERGERLEEQVKRDVIDHDSKRVALRIFFGNTCRVTSTVSGRTRYAWKVFVRGEYDDDFVKPPQHSTKEKMDMAHAILGVGPGVQVEKHKHNGKDAPTVAPRVDRASSVKYRAPPQLQRGGSDKASDDDEEFSFSSHGEDEELASSGPRVPPRVAQKVAVRQKVAQKVAVRQKVAQKVAVRQKVARAPRVQKKVKPAVRAPRVHKKVKPSRRGQKVEPTFEANEDMGFEDDSSPSEGEQVAPPTVRAPRSAQKVAAPVFATDEMEEEADIFDADEEEEAEAMFEDDSSPSEGEQVAPPAVRAPRFAQKVAPPMFEEDDFGAVQTESAPPAQAEPFEEDDEDEEMALEVRPPAMAQKVAPSFGFNSNASRLPENPSFAFATEQVEAVQSFGAGSTLSLEDAAQQTPQADPFAFETNAVHPPRQAQKVMPVFEEKESPGESRPEVQNEQRALQKRAAVQKRAIAQRRAIVQKRVIKQNSAWQAIKKSHRVSQKPRVRQKGRAIKDRRVPQKPRVRQKGRSIKQKSRAPANYSDIDSNKQESGAPANYSDIDSGSDNQPAEPHAAYDEDEDDQEIQKIRRKVPLWELVEAVVIDLHPSYHNPRVLVVDPPFTCERTGWGTFPVQITIVFRAPFEAFQMTLTHHLSLEPDSNGETKPLMLVLGEE